MLNRIFDPAMKIAAPMVFPGAGRDVRPVEVERGLTAGERLVMAPTSADEQVAMVLRAPPGVLLTAPPEVPMRCTLFLYGNAMVLADTPQIRAVLADDGAGVVCVDYVGYGLSPGAPSERGCYRAAHAALEAAEQIAGPGGVDVVGWSLGSAVALQLAASRDVRRLVLLSPMSGVAPYVLAPVRLAGSALRYLGPFAGPGRAAKVRCPVLLISGTADELTPTSMAQDLAAAFRARPGDPGTDLMLVDGARHNDLFSHSEIWHRTLAFVGG